MIREYYENIVKKQEDVLQEAIDYANEICDSVSLCCSDNFYLYCTTYDYLNELVSVDVNEDLEDLIWDVVDAVYEKDEIIIVDTKSAEGIWNEPFYNLKEAVDSAIERIMEIYDCPKEDVVVSKTPENDWVCVDYKNKKCEGYSIFRHNDYFRDDEWNNAGFCAEEFEGIDLD